jgi:peptidoglycan-associated lipoprotein
MRPTLRPTVLLAFAILLAGACRSRPADTPTPADTATATADADRARRDSLAREEEARRRREGDERLARDAAAREAAERVRALMTAPVYFAFDQSDLDAEARRTLDAKLVELDREAAIRLAITGHTDERGSDEYNMALGMRRAAAARRYLTQRGVAEDRLEIDSRGEEQGTCDESTEACWSQNRRAAFAITAGGPVATRE